MYEGEGADGREVEGRVAEDKGDEGRVAETERREGPALAPTRASPSTPTTKIVEGLVEPGPRGRGTRGRGQNGS